MRRAIRSILFSLAILASAGCTLCISQPKTDSTGAKAALEFVTPRPHKSDGSLVTVKYSPSPAESRFYVRLAEEERETGGMLSDYDITNKKGTFVGWFGMVRHVTEDSLSAQTTMLIEMKYQDGLSDSHIMVVSCHGAGDFQAKAGGIHLGIRKLSLVKVYGNVVDEVESIPQLSAEFIRVWDWGLFTFMNYGDQKGNTSWQKLNKIDVVHIYSAFPNRQYYEDRLGQREDDR